LAFFSFLELLDIIIIVFALGFIFEGFLPKRKLADPLDYYSQNTGFGSKFFWKNVLYSAAIVAPAIILHEMGHKFVALSFGATATFHAAYGFLALGIVLKLVNFPFLFFVPAYVAWSGLISPLQSSMIAFAGPAVNIVLWGISKLMLNSKKFKKYYLELAVFARINGFLAIFNLIPIPGFDGFSFFMGLIQTFFL
jgi:Zn-dependent protease